MTAEPKPYVVRYKAGIDPDIKPGIHGRFRTREEANGQVQKALAHFGGVRAKVWVDVDKAALIELQEIEGCEPESDTAESSTPSASSKSAESSLSTAKK